jgi:CubicO group peptidase (beta-lactamase class C family)
MRMKVRRILIISLFFVLIFVPDMMGSSVDKKIVRVNKLFDAWNSPSSPGAVIAVTKDGEIIYKQGYGMANLEHDIPINSKTVFRIGSTSKQFTAACIAKLVLQRKLSLNDKISKYFPELSSIYEPVTIRHLVHHTSGIRDYVDLQELAGVGEEMPYYYTTADVIRLLSRQRSLNFRPGDDYDYSNSGYMLLVEIVKRVTGKPLRQFARENIFSPLGMKHTHFHDNIKIIVKNRASGYSPEGDGYRICMTNIEIVGDAGCITNVEDLYLWDQAFYNGKLGKELVEMMTTPGKLNNGNRIFYAFGLGVDKYRELKTIGHSGWFVGYRSCLLRFPDQHFTVICLSNLETFNPMQICRQVADIFLEDLFSKKQMKPDGKQKKSQKSIKISIEKLKHFAGGYINPDGGKIYRIMSKKNNLVLEGSTWTIDFIPTSETAFFSTDTPREWKLEFKKNQKEKRPQGVIFIEGKKEFTLRPVEFFKPSQKELLEYTGTYYSEELDIRYKVILKDGKLFFDYENSPVAPLLPVLRDWFRLKGRRVTFHRNNKKEIKCFKMDSGNIRGIYFKKILMKRSIG